MTIYNVQHDNHHLTHNLNCSFILVPIRPLCVVWLAQLRSCSTTWGSHTHISLSTLHFPSIIWAHQRRQQSQDCLCW